VERAVKERVAIDEEEHLSRPSFLAGWWPGNPSRY
jgi:hypothetical protein